MSLSSVYADLLAWDQSIPCYALKVPGFGRKIHKNNPDITTAIQEKIEEIIEHNANILTSLIAPCYCIGQVLEKCKVLKVLHIGSSKSIIPVLYENRNTLKDVRLSSQCVRSTDKHVLQQCKHLRVLQMACDRLRTGRDAMGHIQSTRERAWRDMTTLYLCLKRHLLKDLILLICKFVWDFY